MRRFLGIAGAIAVAVAASLRQVALLFVALPSGFAEGGADVQGHTAPPCPKWPRWWHGTRKSHLSDSN